LSEAVVVETNVIIVANRKSTQADIECLLSCIGALEKAREMQIVVIDSGMGYFRNT